MERENIMQCLSRTGALATQTYQRALERAKSISTTDTGGLNISQNRNVSAMPAKGQGVTFHHCKSSCCPHGLRLHLHHPQPSKSKKTPMRVPRKHKHPMENDMDPTEPCNINTTMKKIQEHMDMVSFHCECYYDSCPRRHLSRSDRRHLRAFHMGVLQSPARPRRSRPKGAKPRASPKPKKSSKLIQTADKSSGTKSELSLSAMMENSDSSDLASSTSPSPETSDEQGSKEIEELLEDADIIVRIKSPIGDDVEISETEVRENKTTTKSRSDDLNRLQTDTSNEPESESLMSSLELPLSQKFLMSRNSQALYNTTWYKNQHFGSQGNEEKSSFEPTGTASPSPSPSDESEEDSSLALKQELERQRSSEKHVWFGKTKQEEERDESQNALTQPPEKRTFKNKTIGYNLDSGSYVQGVSAFPTGGSHPNAVHIEKHNKKAPSQVNHTTNEQGILIMTKPGRYIVRARPGGNASHISINPGNFVNLKL